MQHSFTTGVSPKPIHVSGIGVYLLYFFTAVCCLLFYSCTKNHADQLKVEEKLISDAEATNTDCICGPVINQYIWKGQVIYIKNCTGPQCDCISFFYNSKGEEFFPGTMTGTILEKARFRKKVWSCP